MKRYLILAITVLACAFVGSSTGAERVSVPGRLATPETGIVTHSAPGPNDLTRQPSAVLFEDVSQPSGLAAYLADWQLAHAAAWGDVDGDGRPDLFVGAFADRPVYAQTNAPIPNQLFLNKGDRFVRSDDPSIQLRGLRARTTSSIFVDLDNDGDLDLVMGNHGSKPDQPQSMLFENDGTGRFKDVTPPTPPWPRPLGVRNIAALDLDGDGLLDLVFTDGNYSNWHNGEGPLRALRNTGKLTFADDLRSIGLPEKGAVGMGLAVGDVNDDGIFDVFVADCSRLFVSDTNGHYRESQPGTFIKPTGRTESHVCGAAFGDLDGDGLLDLVTTEHGQPAQLRLYMNRGIKDGLPTYVETTAALGPGNPLPRTGITGLPIKGTQVSIQDVDNDGRADIMFAIVYRDDQGRFQPVVLRNLGNRDGQPRFTPLPSTRMYSYAAPGPVTDFDRDGRMDIFIPNWSTNNPPTLFRNVTPNAGHWLEVRVAGKGRYNPMGIGSTVRVYAAGHAGDPRHLLARRDIAIGCGYSSGEEALVHVGLGTATHCDVQVTWGRQVVTMADTAADQFLTVPFAP